MLEELINNLQLGSLSPFQVTSNLLVALVLTLITSAVYRWTHTGYAYSRSFNITLVGVSMVVCMMMMVIGHYLALSLGLIGALSVIRFRTAVKDPKDMAYLFIAIAIGLACSTGDYVIAVVGTLIIDTTLFVLHFLRFGAKLSSDYILSFSVEVGSEAVEQALEKARGQFKEMVFRSFAHVSESVGEYVFTLHLGSVSEQEAIRFFTAETPVFKNVSLIAPESTIEN